MPAFGRFAAALVAIAVAVFATVDARAQVVSPADQAEIHKVIQIQIDAFKRADFEAAYAVAAPSQKVFYPTVQAFSAMIKSRFAQLISPKAVVFGTITQTSQGPVQRVFVTANDGIAYIANYSMQRQSENVWLITGVTLARDRASSGI